MFFFQEIFLIITPYSLYLLKNVYETFFTFFITESIFVTLSKNTNDVTVLQSCVVAILLDILLINKSFVSIVKFISYFS